MFSPTEAESAKARVFQTTELAEAILLPMDPREILSSLLGTHRYFKEVIEGSPSLQRKLWLAPSRVLPKEEQVVYI